MRFSVTSWFVKVWHMPEHFHWMDPLPMLHRRGIILSSLIIALCLIWPAGESSSQPAPLTANQGVQTSDSQPLRFDSPDNQESNGSSVAIPSSTIQDEAIDQQWRSYRIAPGQTLAQLFRDNNLPPTDVYAMAQVEGNDKPLSNLQPGQTIKIRENANGVVTGLIIDSDKGNNQIRFMRQTDGNFTLEK